MKKKMRHNELRLGHLQNLRSNCNQCSLKREEICPYLETIANCHLFNSIRSGEALNGFKKEKRQYPRIITSIPAFISNSRSGEEKLPIGSIIDVSLGGLQISIPRKMKYKVLSSRKTTEFEIITKLPNGNKPIHLKCKSQRVISSKGNINVGASVVDADFRSYKALKNYVM